MEIKGFKLENAVSVSAHGLLIGRYLMEQTLRQLPVVPEVTRNVVQTAFLKVPMFNSQLLSERLQAEHAQAKLMLEADNEEVFGHKNRKAYEEDQKAIAREQKASEARTAYLEDLRAATIEPSTAIEHATFDDAIVERQLGQFAVTGSNRE